MTKEKLDKMCCSFDKQDLRLQIFVEDDAQVLEGLFICNVCHRYYPIIAGIPIMVPDEFREHDFEKSFLAKWSQEIPKLEDNFRVEESKQIN